MADEQKNPQHEDDDTTEHEPRPDERKREEPRRRGLIIAPTEGDSDVQPEP